MLLNVIFLCLKNHPESISRVPSMLWKKINYLGQSLHCITEVHNVRVNLLFHTFLVVDLQPDLLRPVLKLFPLHPVSTKMVANGAIWISIFGARTFHCSRKITTGNVLKADTDIEEQKSTLSHLIFPSEHTETFPTHVWGKYICGINGNVWLLRAVWLASSYAQCIYFKFRRDTHKRFPKWEEMGGVLNVKN